MKKKKKKKSESHSVMSDSLQPHGLCSSWNSPGQNTGVSSLFLLQGIFPSQGLSPSLLHSRQNLYQLSHKGSPKYKHKYKYKMVFPGGPSDKELACQCRRHTRRVPSLDGKIPWRKTWQPTPVFLPGDSHGQRSLTGYSP